jgi:glyoxylase-like metal-dependent hydrolase (beta-lactamase superfamily II)
MAPVRSASGIGLGRISSASNSSPGAAPAKGLPERGQRLEARAPVVAEAQGADLAHAGTAGGRDRGIRSGQCAPRALEKLHARLGERDLSGATQEQAGADLALELANREAERRLRHVQALGRVAEVQLFGHRDEVAQVPELDHLLRGAYAVGVERYRPRVVVRGAEAQAGWLVPTIHTVTSPAGALVNAYLVETAAGVVAIDAMLTESDGRNLRTRLEAIGKPLLAVLLTHSHPDHYGGLTWLLAGDDVPVAAPQGVHDVIRRDDPLKEQILRPMFGDEWPRRRTFPNTAVRDGEMLTFDGVGFSVIDLGPSESPHDSPWFLAAHPGTVFLRDQMYGRKHCFLADGYYAEWLANIGSLRTRFPAGDVFHVGHGGPLGQRDRDWQQRYLETFVAAVEHADWTDPGTAHAHVVATMRRYLPTDDLAFLMELSVEPIATQMGLLASTATP